MRELYSDSDDFKHFILMFVNTLGPIFTIDYLLISVLIINILAVY